MTSCGLNLSYDGLPFGDSPKVYYSIGCLNTICSSISNLNTSIVLPNPEQPRQTEVLTAADPSTLIPQLPRGFEAEDSKQLFSGCRNKFATPFIVIEGSMRTTTSKGYNK